MSSKNITIPIDAREVLGAVAVKVQLQHTLRVRIGVWLVRLGCKLAGMKYVEEFPMSLIQPGEGE